MPTSHPLNDESTGAHQNVARARAMLDALAVAAEKGLRFSDAVQATGLNKAVVARLLSGLVAHGLASYDEANRVYFLGDTIYAWAMRAGGRFEIARRAEPHLRRLADRTSDTVYLLVHSQDHVICAGRAEGGYPVKTLVLEVGDRRPHGLSAGSLAILGAMDPVEADGILVRNAADLAAQGLGIDAARKLLASSRRSGHAALQGQLIPGMSAVAMPIPSSGVPTAAFSVAAVAARLAPPRRAEVLTMLEEACRTFASEYRVNS